MEMDAIGIHLGYSAYLRPLLKIFQSFKAEKTASKESQIIKYRGVTLDDTSMTVYTKYTDCSKHRVILIEWNDKGSSMGRKRGGIHDDTSAQHWYSC